MKRIRPSGPGRPKGRLNNRTAERIRKLAASGYSPLEFFLAMMRDETASDEDRKWGADHAAPYMHPRLAATETRISGELTLEQMVLKSYEVKTIGGPSIEANKLNIRQDNPVVTLLDAAVAMTPTKPPRPVRNRGSPYGSKRKRRGATGKRRGPKPKTQGEPEK